MVEICDIEGCEERAADRVKFLGNSGEHIPVYKSLCKKHYFGLLNSDYLENFGVRWKK